MRNPYRTPAMQEFQRVLIERRKRDEALGRVIVFGWGVVAAFALILALLSG